jgi:hypothetical protein
MGRARPRRVAAWACGAFLLAAGALYLATAAAAPKESAYGKWDLEILRRWGQTGVLAPRADLPDHMLKPGYILYLRTLLGASAPFPIGRVLIVNALLAVISFAAVTIALWKTRRFRAALLAAAFFLFFSPLRDCADDVMSELPSAAGLLGCLALLVLAVEGRDAFYPATGLLAALIALLRPNVGELAVAIGAVAAAGTPRGLRKAAALVGCFIAGTALATGMGRWKHISLNPLSVEASTPLLWGAADYYWKPDVGAWPSGLDAAEKGREERSAAARLWKAKFQSRSRDDRRALLWKLGHAVLSSEQLPPRWRPPAYLAYDKAIRRWWWLAALGLLTASAAAAFGGRGPWRLAPVVIAAAIVAQGAVFGADPRFALPLVPAWCVVLLLALPGSVLSPRALAAGAATLAAFVALLTAAPDASTSDYAVVRGPAPLSFRIPASAFARTAGRATIHVRFLELSQKFDRGVTIEAGGRPLQRYEPDPARPYPAFLSAVVDGELLETARRAGLVVDLRPGGAADWNFFYFPVIPPPWAAPATINADAAIESGYGGTTNGGIPWWIHDGADVGRPGRAADAP